MEEEKTNPQKRQFLCLREENPGHTPHACQTASAISRGPALVASLILSTARCPLPLSALAGSVGCDKRGNGWSLSGASGWILQPSYGSAPCRSRRGALGGVFDVFVLFRAEFRVTPTRINELLRRLMLAFKSPLALWLRCPHCYPPSFLFHTHNQLSHTQAKARSFTLPAGSAMPRSCILVR